ncbi:TPA: oligosaccharide repeat unit polymerase, partial [Bacillus cereus]|nr:oligosaccharide repeat unit polymerase [Bacillus cereus]
MKYKNVKYLMLISFILLSGILVLFSSDPVYQIYGMVLLCIGAIIISGFDLIHPYFWYSTIFTLYSISYPILYINEKNTLYGLSNQLMIMQWLALVVFLIIVTPTKVSRLTTLNFRRVSLLNKRLYQFLSILIVLSVINITRSGFSTKLDIYESGNIINIIAFRAVLLLIILYIYRLTEKFLFNNQIDTGLIIKTGIVIMLMVIFSGERDILFRYVVITGLILYYFKIIKNIHLPLLIPVAVIAMPLTHVYKYYFLDGTTRVSSLDANTNIFFEFLSGEFVTASRNLQVLINNSSMTEGLYNGYTILNATLRTLFLDTDFSLISWYNDTFFPQLTKTGYGFTLVGEGYVNWGYWGIVIVFSIFGLFIKLLY